MEIGFGYEQINLILDKNTHTGAQFTAVKNDKLIRIDRDWIWIFLDLNSEFNQTETFKLEAQKLKFANWNLEIEIFPKEHLKQISNKHALWGHGQNLREISLASMGVGRSHETVWYDNRH